MNIDVKFRGLESSAALRDYIVKKIHTHLGRFGHDLTSVTVRVDDVNGPRGGDDKVCKITLKGPRVGSETVFEKTADPYAAADKAVDTAETVIVKVLERLRSSRRDYSMAGPSVA
jgi:putative sigma-54 modulation protein